MKTRFSFGQGSVEKEYIQKWIAPPAEKSPKQRSKTKNEIQPQTSVIKTVCTSPFQDQ